ncbi:MAG: D-tyrosyl-tRNA(Tyr) deacylase [Clostridia bacterium]|nr:D-tyrosyl-tRNA(Tyr) deacylase [Clostridia bacterium]
MKAVVQRVDSAKLSVDGKVVSQIQKGFVVYFGVKEGDDKDKADYLAKKISGLRVFEDQNGKMNLSLADVGGSILFVSQFTLIADVSRGNRPSFSDAMRPDKANEIYLYCADKIGEYGVNVELGVFGADMVIEQVNHGPVTIIYEV